MDHVSDIGGPDEEDENPFPDGHIQALSGDESPHHQALRTEILSKNSTSELIFQNLKEKFIRKNSSIGFILLNMFLITRILLNIRR